jgi:hypothetical protein
MFSWRVFIFHDCVLLGKYFSRVFVTDWFWRDILRDRHVFYSLTRWPTSSRLFLGICLIAILSANHAKSYPSPVLLHVYVGVYPSKPPISFFFSWKTAGSLLLLLTFFLFWLELMIYEWNLNTFHWFHTNIQSTHEPTDHGRKRHKFGVKNFKFSSACDRSSSDPMIFFVCCHDSLVFARNRLVLVLQLKQNWIWNLVLSSPPRLVLLLPTPTIVCVCANPPPQSLMSRVCLVGVYGILFGIFWMSDFRSDSLSDCDLRFSG